MRRRALTADETREVERLAMLIARHAARFARAGKLSTCACDLCRHATRRLEKINAGR